MRTIKLSAVTRCSPSKIKKSLFEGVANLFKINNRNSKPTTIIKNNNYEKGKQRYDSLKKIVYLNYKQNACEKGKWRYDSLNKVLSLTFEIPQKVLFIDKNSSEILEKKKEFETPFEYYKGNAMGIAKIIGTEQAKLSLDESIFKQELVLRSKEFKRQAPTQNTLSVAESCQKELELTLPYGQLSFSSFYEADITDKKSITVRQYLLIRYDKGLGYTRTDSPPIENGYALGCLPKT